MCLSMISGVISAVIVRSLISDFLVFSHKFTKKNAFFWQGYGRQLWLMQGIFKANGGSGYVKKPDFLSNTGPKNEGFNPTSKLPVTFKVNGQQ